MKKLLSGVACVLLLAGCGDPFVGTYNFDGSDETLTIKSNGTCEDKAGGISLGCTWKKVGNDQYEIRVNTMFGDIPYEVNKLNSGTYELSSGMLGTRTIKKN